MKTLFAFCLGALSVYALYKHHEIVEDAVDVAISLERLDSSDSLKVNIVPSTGQDHGAAWADNAGSGRTWIKDIKAYI